jgi:DNA-binding NarL/FixJ family response regulator
MTPPVVEIVVIDDHPAVLAGIAAWCADADPPIRILASGGDVAVACTGPGREASVIVLDSQLQSGPPAYDELRRFADAGRQVIVYSVRDDTKPPITYLELGAFTYLNKAEGPDRLVAAIHAAGQERPYPSTSLAGSIAVDTGPESPRLSVREREVLIEWFRCESKQTAAERLHLSARSVSTYLDRVRIKYANTGRPAPTKAVLLARAIQDGLIAPHEL